MKQLLLYLTVRRLVDRITDRADQSLATSVSNVTVRSFLTRVVFVGALPAADLAIASGATPTRDVAHRAHAAASTACIVDAAHPSQVSVLPLYGPRGICLPAGARTAPGLETSVAAR